jgi:hypothetical protein
MPEAPKTTVPATISADADDRMIEIDENFMAVPFFHPAILLCHKDYLAFSNSSVR